MFSLALLAIQCGLVADAAVLEAIVRVESRGDPYALHVNGEVELVRRPRDRGEAERMAKWLLEHGYNFDAGLGQVNSANWGWLGLDASSVFDPCTNLTAASRVLHDCYDRAAERLGGGDLAVTAALSCYNTGDFARGVWNGYAGAVRAKAGEPLRIASRAERDAAAGICSAAAPRPAKERTRAKRERSVALAAGPPEGGQADIFGEPLAEAFEGARAERTQ